MAFNVEPLKINYRTLEEFKQFHEYGQQELSMLEDLQENIIENNSSSPFYGIYMGDKLVARMSLYRRASEDSDVFETKQKFLELWKLEVLPDYQSRGLGTRLVSYAKDYGIAIKTNSRMKSKDFWEKNGFIAPCYKIERDLGQNPMIWEPN
ncbi:hypothetical protein Q75_05595 [Bacillus coahuilensis p1.1.43]|uniref:N-acetyltransferase domain-containing protein n=1 Tax=Bacillus coahuilensis p1.1.43 TaxID=1150625 RepID=A0A147K9W3_9BACI|nr:N-acetyltransferase [Bacillus coahuilensis]KUP07329.1 hypothetical protein Q75_05595 [Bacillus coahuilensis p1.1.43]